MLNKKAIDIATREELADELAAAGEYTLDWEMTDMDDLRERVRRVMKKLYLTTK